MDTLKYILFMIGGGIIGYFGNRYANKKTEEHIINAFTAQIKALQEQIKVGRGTGIDQGRLEGLEMALDMLKNK